MSDLTVANTIKDQIGGRALFMLGAKDLMGDEKSLTFTVRGSRKVSKIRIILSPDDTYRLEGYKGRGLNIRMVSQCEYVHVESLHSMLETMTGLYVSL